MNIDPLPVLSSPAPGKGARHDYCGAIALGVGVHGAWLTYEAFELRRSISEATAWSQPSGGMGFGIGFIIIESFAVALLLGAFAIMFWLYSWFMRPGKSQIPSILQCLGLVSCLPFIYTVLSILLRIVRGMLGV